MQYTVEDSALANIKNLILVRDLRQKATFIILKGHKVGLFNVAPYVQKKVD